MAGVRKEYVCNVIRDRFLPVAGLCKRRLRLNVEGAYSLTPFNCSMAMLQRLSGVCRQWLNRPLSECSVVEGFAGQGGDTVVLLVCGRVRHLTAVEVSPEHMQNLVHNVAEYQKALYSLRRTDRHSTVAYRQDDIVRLLVRGLLQAQDVVYLDPPWGGPAYRQNPAIWIPREDGGAVSLEDLALLAASITRVLVIKLPALYNCAGLERALGAHTVCMHTFACNKILFFFAVISAVPVPPPPPKPRPAAASKHVLQVAVHQTAPHHPANLFHQVD